MSLSGKFLGFFKRSHFTWLALAAVALHLSAFAWHSKEHAAIDVAAAHASSVSTAAHEAEFVTAQGPLGSGSLKHNDDLCLSLQCSGSFTPSDALQPLPAFIGGEATVVVNTAPRLGLPEAHGFLSRAPPLV